MIIITTKKLRGKAKKYMFNSLSEAKKFMDKLLEVEQPRDAEQHVHPTKSGGELDLPEPSKNGYPYDK